MPTRAKMTQVSNRASWEESPTTEIVTAMSQKTTKPNERRFVGPKTHHETPTTKHEITTTVLKNSAIVLVGPAGLNLFSSAHTPSAMTMMPSNSRVAVVRPLSRS